MLDEASARVMVARESFSTSVVGRVGVEVEWPVADANGARPSHRQLLESLCTPTALPYGSRVSLEPGGQVEVSSAPSESLAACIRATMADVDCLRARARAAELIMMDSAFDLREPRRVVNSRWYTALERQYAQFGPEGYAFICNAASVQVNVDAGAPVAGYAGREHRWWLANQLGPMLTALFANSPAPSPNGAVTLRQLTRFRTDPSRTDPPVGVGSGMDT